MRRPQCNNLFLSKLHNVGTYYVLASKRIWENHVFFFFGYKRESAEKKQNSILYSIAMLKRVFFYFILMEVRYDDTLSTYSKEIKSNDFDFYKLRKVILNRHELLSIFCIKREYVFLFFSIFSVYMGYSGEKFKMLRFFCFYYRLGVVY